MRPFAVAKGGNLKTQFGCDQNHVISIVGLTIDSRIAVILTDRIKVIAMLRQQQYAIRAKQNAC
jgi:hypothetical protein